MKGWEVTLTGLFLFPVSQSQVFKTFSFSIGGKIEDRAIALVAAGKGRIKHGGQMCCSNRIKHGFNRLQ